jgi:hypothetical protein
MKLERLSVFALWMVLCVSGWASQQNTPAAPPAATAASAPIAAPATTVGAPSAVPAQVDPQAAVKERATAFYTSLTGGDRKAAEQMVTPESRDDFEQADFKALSAFTLDKIAVDPSGSKADVTVTRIFSGPFGMNMPWHDEWVNVDGQWFLALPKSTHETPFGVIAPKPADTKPIDPEVMKRITERRAQKVDPDQYMKQVEKYVSEHPDALPPMEMQVPVPQQISNSQSQHGAKAAANSKPATPPATTDKNKNKKKKDSKKSEKPQENAATPPKS